MPKPPAYRQWRCGSPTAIRARALYTRLGFRSTGQRAPLRENDPSGEQKERMIRGLTAVRQQRGGPSVAD